MYDRFPDLAHPAIAQDHDCMQQHVPLSGFGCREHVECDSEKVQIGPRIGPKQVLRSFTPQICVDAFSSTEPLLATCLLA